MSRKQAGVCQLARCSWCRLVVGFVRGGAFVVTVLILQVVGEPTKGTGVVVVEAMPRLIVAWRSLMRRAGRLLPYPWFIQATWTRNGVYYYARRYDMAARLAVDRLAGTSPAVNPRLLRSVLRSFGVWVAAVEMRGIAWAVNIAAGLGLLFPAAALTLGLVAVYSLLGRPAEFWAVALAGLIVSLAPSYVGILIVRAPTARLALVAGMWSAMVLA
jgi:hypothetical protein